MSSNPALQHIPTILRAWFRHEGAYSSQKVMKLGFQAHWFMKDPAFDQELKTQFSSLWQQVRDEARLETGFTGTTGGLIQGFKSAHLEGQPELCAKQSEGYLALIILLDQYSRNMLRGDGATHDTDALALELAKEAIDLNLDKELLIADNGTDNLQDLVNDEGKPVPLVPLMFLYMPFMHSETLGDQEKGLDLFKQYPGLQDNVGHAEEHLDIVKRFGRFPHRNTLLGRESTPEELEFLKDFKGF
jgi:uncharacterized protein (DUF924 family)